MRKLILGAKKLGLELTPNQIAHFETYYRELVDWNQRMNLTAITDYAEVQTKHFLDSLTVTLALKPPVKDLRVIDVGTGAGLPGIPLKIIFPQIKLTLLDATAKKATFLSHLKTKLGLDDVEIVVGRAEQVAHDINYREKFDIALSRAVAFLPALVELTLPFCAIGGTFIAQKSANVILRSPSARPEPVEGSPHPLSLRDHPDEAKAESGGEAIWAGRDSPKTDEVTQATRAITLLGGNLRAVKKIDLEELPERWLVIIDKVSPTPSQYPRRPGIPAKRPIV